MKPSCAKVFIEERDLCGLEAFVEKLVTEPFKKILPIQINVFLLHRQIFLKCISKVRFLEKEKVGVVASLKSPFGRNSWGRKERRVTGEEKASPWLRPGAIFEASISLSLFWPRP